MGFLKKRGNRWYCVFDIPTDNGKRKQKWVAAYMDKARSEKLLTKLENQVNEGKYIEPSEQPLGEYLTEWLRSKKGNLSDQTYDQYKYFCELYIIPKLGHRKLGRLKTSHIKSFYNELRESSSLSAGSIYRLHTAFKSAMSSAMEDEMIPKNPTKYKDAPKKPEDEMKYWNEESAWKFLEVAEEDRTYIAFYLAIKTGMRQGEILGLKWNDIDLEKQTISVQRQLKHDGSGFKPPKNNSKRTFWISESTIEQLKQHAHRVKIERARHGEMYKNQGLVIPTALGTPLIPRNLNRTWYRLRKKAKVEEIRFHDLRHTHVAIAIKSREPLHSIANRIGHKSIQQIDQTYGHLMPGIQETAAANFDEQFESKRSVENNG